MSPSPNQTREDSRRVQKAHSIIRSARSTMDDGIVMPSNVAVRLLMASSNLVGCSIASYRRLAFTSQRLALP